MHGVAVAVAVWMHAGHVQLSSCAPHRGLHKNARAKLWLDLLPTDRVDEGRQLALPTLGSEVPELPLLNEAEEELVRSGRTLQWQRPPETGGIGSGFAVLELRTDPEKVWLAVSTFSQYPKLIPTVRMAKAYEAGEHAGSVPPNTCRFSFLVSRIRLRLDVRLTTDDALRYAAWQLDRPSWVLSDSSGYWRVQICDDRPGIARVWFCVSVTLSKRVPAFVVALVSRLGLSKATRWLKVLEDP